MKKLITVAMLPMLVLVLVRPSFGQTVDDPRGSGENIGITPSVTGTATTGKLPGLAANIEKIVGEEMCFTLTAKDSRGNVIRDWRTTGKPTTLTLKYGANPPTTANTDSSTQSWNADPLGYSFAMITNGGLELAKLSADEWSIPSTAFDSVGQAIVCLIHTRADTGVYIVVTPQMANLKQESAHVDFRADAITNFLVDLTSSTIAGNQVFHERPYEIVVSPRDRYLNVSNEVIRTRFSARFPGEFDSNNPGLADIFSGDVFLSGPTNYLVASRIVRELPNDQLQWIMAYAAADQNINGRTNEYEVLRHAPVPFALQSPVDHYFFNYIKFDDTLPFTWDRPNPPDPYTNIQISRFDPRTYSDNVTYKWIMVDSLSLTQAQELASNSGGTLPTLTLTHGQFASVVRTISGQQTTLMYNVVWSVQATDGLYTRMSSPPFNDANNRPGHYMTVYMMTTGVNDPKVSLPTQLDLKQNYPNPFNPSTTISFALPTNAKTTLKVYDLVGAEVATVVDNTLKAGEYSVLFDAAKLPSGIYIYKLQAGGKTLTRRMALMK